MINSSWRRAFAVAAEFMDFENPFASGAGASRYELQRKLGAGASGTVYLVRDRETGESLALKQLHRTDDRGIARLKREFRSLANIQHPNVIRLYDLARAHDVWFLTMEYIEGTDLAAYLRRSTSISATLEWSTAGASDLQRIATVFHQLASGVHALHRAQVLHRDLKPSNVLVAGHRVVVVDFGLALEVGDEAATVTLDGRITGTPAYMAPEQVQGRDWGEPNDWYSFGAMLYEALSGRLPHEGRIQDILHRKLEADPIPLDRIVTGLPAELCRLCTGLLQRRPELRPSVDEVLAVLQACAKPDTISLPPEPITASQPTLPRQRSSEPPFIGRELERAQLRAALEEAATGAFATVHVCGVSGAGKSALVERFLDEFAQGELHAPLILRGRCYEREAVPFKALDAAMDALVTQLRREDDLTVGHVLPRDIAALAQVFPTLRRLSAIDRLLSAAQPAGATAHAREAAEAALRDLFSRLTSRRLVVLWIDDLHWGDLDSARIIRSWIEAPEIAGMLLILSYRSDEVSTSPCLRVVAPEAARSETERVIALGPLEDDQIRTLCLQRFGSDPARAAALGGVVDRVVGEARGSPFLASQLATLASIELGAGPDQALRELTVEALVERRTAALSPPAQRLLNLLSVASRPLPMKLALQLLAVEGSGRAALHELSSLGLIRTRDSANERLLAVYHDRLREGVLARLGGSERAELDRVLLSALEAQGGADAAWLHALALGAGERAAALRYGLAAAERASSALAFERAVQLYRTCLELCPERAPEQLEIWHKLGLALGHSGHGRQAAAAYLEAARRAEGERALSLERSAASHLLRSGCFEDGEALVHKVLAAMKLETPETPAGLIAAIAWERAQLALRGMRFTPTRRLEDVPFRERFGGELCGTLSIEIQPYDSLRAALLQVRSLRIALRAGVPELFARALCVAATMAAVTGGGRGSDRAEELLARASELARGFSSPLVEGNIASARAVCAMLDGRMEDVVEHSAEAERRFREVNASDDGEYYHRYTVLTSRFAALIQLGQHQKAHAEMVALLNEARATENIAALLFLSTVRTRFDLMYDEARNSVARLMAERDQLPSQRFGLLHVYHLSSVLRIGCVTGDADWVARASGDQWAQFQDSIFKRAGHMAVIIPALHARLLLNQSVAQKHSAAEAEARIATELRMLGRFKEPGAKGALVRTRARLSLLAGDRARAVAELEQSARLFAQVKLSDEAARDRCASGVLRGGPDGTAREAAAFETLRSLGYVNPRCDLASYYPELLPP